MSISDKLVDVGHPRRDDTLPVALIAALPVRDIGLCIVSIHRVDLFLADAAFHCRFPFSSGG